MPTILIRPATPADVPAIGAFIRELAEYEKSLVEARATDAMLHAALFGPRASCEALMGEVDGVVRGTAVYFHNFSTWVGKCGIYLEDLYVQPQARGVGLGRALLARVAAVAVERGFERMDWAVLDWNTSAAGFYKALGADALDEWTIFRLKGAALKKLAGEA